ncbi:transcriptional regulator [uncultured Microbacterium sp.]|uniref:transcriptional regulator n=1 Tax=uncultured Microbacterium sp. TaxID=191216 RepID=UPI00260E9797|nr:transcriptional regulator [uncultured Microbacterium sp.]
MTEQHPRLRLDDNFASPIRFSLMAALLDGDILDFATLAGILQVGDSALSKSISHLSAAGYIVSRRGEVGSRPRTWVRATVKGARAFTAHLAALQEIVEFGGRPSF